MKCATTEGPCSICETYVESASVYCCREDLNDQRECSESELKVIWTPQASIFTSRFNQPTHNKLKCYEATAPSASDILGEEHAEILSLNEDTRYYVLINDLGRIS